MARFALALALLVLIAAFLLVLIAVSVSWSRARRDANRYDEIARVAERGLRDVLADQQCVGPIRTHVEVALNKIDDARRMHLAAGRHAAL